jgi:hypothetical protein
VVTGRCTGCGHGLTGRVRSVLSSCQARGFVTGRWSGLTSVSDQFSYAQKKSARPARPVPHGIGASGQASRGAERNRVLIGRAARPVMCDRTRPVAVGAYWTPIGRQVQRVRSFARARPVIATVISDAHYSRLSYSDRTRPVTLTGASGQLVLNCVIR